MTRINIIFWLGLVLLGSAAALVWWLPAVIQTPRDRMLFYTGVGLFVAGLMCLVFALGLALRHHHRQGPRL